jgi:hypothetical protein
LGGAVIAADEHLCPQSSLERRTILKLERRLLFKPYFIQGGVGPHLGVNLLKYRASRMVSAGLCKRYRMGCILYKYFVSDGVKISDG